MRVFFAAVAFSAISFAAGVVGDLSRAAPVSAGAAVTVRLPPELPADAVRAAPLPPLIIRTPSAAAAEFPRAELVVLEQAQEIALPLAKPRIERVLHAPDTKHDEGAETKAKRDKAA